MTSGLRNCRQCYTIDVEFRHAEAGDISADGYRDLFENSRNAFAFWRIRIRRDNYQMYQQVLEKSWEQVEVDGDFGRNNKAVASAPFSVYLYFIGTIASN